MDSGNLLEERIGKKWDVCLTDTALKFGGGLIIGTLVSLLFFKRRSFPIMVGAGFGLGMGYSNCERELNELLQIEPCTEINKEIPKTEETS